MSNIPQNVNDKLSLARDYLERGWRIFVVRQTKRPLANCPDCAAAGPEHDREACSCLTCHGFYAATDSLDRIGRVLARVPDGLLAVRTGTPSGLAVLDFESTSDGPDQPSGLEVADSWESWLLPGRRDDHDGGGGDDDDDGWRLPPLPRTLRQRTATGGLHLVYGLDPAGPGLRGRNRILPGTDLKADGGYVVVPPGGGRRWEPAGDELDPATVTPLPAGLARVLALLARGRARSRGSGSGDDGGGTGAGSGGGSGGDASGGGGRYLRPDTYDFTRFYRDGCPGGLRDEFFNDLIFRLRRRGTAPADAVQIVYEAWRGCAQPPRARWAMPWAHVRAKFPYVWRNVEPDPALVLDDVTKRWLVNVAAARTGGRTGGTAAAGTYVVGRKTMVRRGDR